MSAPCKDGLKDQHQKETKMTASSVLTSHLLTCLTMNILFPKSHQKLKYHYVKTDTVSSVKALINTKHEWDTRKIEWSCINYVISVFIYIHVKQRTTVLVREM